MESTRKLFTELSGNIEDLLSFVQVNSEGFRKIVKKHDKLTREQILPEFMVTLRSQSFIHVQEVFNPILSEIDNLIQSN